MPRYDSDPSQLRRLRAATLRAAARHQRLPRSPAATRQAAARSWPATPASPTCRKTDSQPGDAGCDGHRRRHRELDADDDRHRLLLQLRVRPNNTPEICDGVDNDCDGCIDNGLTAPAICSTKGVCSRHGAATPVACKGAAGYKCTYTGVPASTSTPTATWRRPRRSATPRQQLQRRLRRELPRRPSGRRRRRTAAPTRARPRAARAGRARARSPAPFACNAAKSAERTDSRRHCHRRHRRHDQGHRREVQRQGRRLQRPHRRADRLPPSARRRSRAGTIRWCRSPLPPIRSPARRRTRSTSTRTKRRGPTRPATRRARSRRAPAPTPATLPWSNVTLGAGAGGLRGDQGLDAATSMALVHGVGVAADLQRQRGIAGDRTGRCRRR